ncbi:MAG: RluA family pseudouridine synthase [Crocinitomicaceae bacterium]|nr:RluA family pseudouridine synthase [Crocinitomicaceae bacterium]
MKLLVTHTFPVDAEPLRIYDYCTGLFKELPSRKSVKKAIERGQIRLNGEATETGFWLNGGETIELYDLEDTPPKEYRLKLEVLYEDEDLAVIVKPAGLLTSGNSFKTVTNALSYNLSPSTSVDKLNWAKPVHRLDKATSGILLIAKSRSAHMKLTQQFEKNQVKKTYHALVLGKMSGDGVMDTPIDQKEATTHYTVVRSIPSIRSGHLSLVQLHPKTGRRHQLRIHLSTLGHAILGDSIYSPKELYLKHKGLFLAATAISFRHPIQENPMNFSIPIPSKMQNRLKYEEKRWNRANLE